LANPPPSDRPVLDWLPTGWEKEYGALKRAKGFCRQTDPNQSPTGWMEERRRRVQLGAFPARPVGNRSTTGWMEEERRRQRQGGRSGVVSNQLETGLRPLSLILPLKYIYYKDFYITISYS
jgi:hypothetical protein